ncbi:hypothetical protein NHQ30_001463 [Ciborinia camelliae]|nr:hypothetical protein NHQ30_001463 [Ciborinia camelliae]
MNDARTSTSRGRSDRGSNRGRGRGNRVPRSHGHVPSSNPHFSPSSSASETSHTYTQGQRQGQVQVPRIALLHPGTPVSIVLKVDQGSGRQVLGFIGELLTRGDHPRGVKVRLRDGRVGRVQRVVGVGEAEVACRGLGGLGENGEVGGGGGRGGGRGRGRGVASATDFRFDGYGYDESSALSNSAGAGTGAGASLSDYIIVKDKRKGRQGRSVDIQGDSSNNDEREGRDDERRRENENQYSEEAVDGGVDGTSTSDVFTSQMSICPVCAEFEGDEMAVAHHVNAHFE